MRFKGGIEASYGNADHINETGISRLDSSFESDLIEREIAKARLEKLKENSRTRIARTVSLEAPKDGINVDYIDELKPYHSKNNTPSDDINAKDIYSQTAEMPADELEIVKALDREIEAMLMQGHDEFKAIAEGDFEEVTADWDDDLGEESKGKSR